MRKFIIIVIALLSIFASSTKTGGTAANSGGGIAWSNPTNGQACDNTYTTVVLSGEASSKYLLVTNFGFTIPTGATIDGTVVSIQWKGTILEAGVKDFDVSLVKSGIASGDNKAVAIVLPTVEETRNYGGASDTWGAGFTYTDWNASTSGARIKLQEGGGLEMETGYIDCVQITVYYTEAGGTKRYLIGYSRQVEF
ncbi:MAG: hypothetical protein EPO24_07835 [Bacteroidetes bacterium]|nr:MAG: hypothetical protein EPO24_07835 [Bacteroidota bacterium]